MDKDERHQELLEQATAGLRRAAKNAELISRKTGTPLIVWQDGKVVDALAEERKRNYQRERESGAVIREEPEGD